MKNLLALNIILFLGITLKAQTLTIGPKVGANYSAIVINEAINSNGFDFTYITQKPEFSPNIGVFTRIKLGNIYLQPEILLTQDQTTMQLAEVNFNTINDLQTMTYNKIDIPIMVGFSLIQNVVRLNIGFVRTQYLSGSLKNHNELYSSFQDNFDNNSWGLQVGIGTDISRLVLDLRYETSLYGINTKVEINGETFKFDQRSNIFQTTLGYKLLK